MTDGKSHQTVTGVINRLKRTSDPLIGAGIGADTDEDFLLTLSSNLSTVVYEPDRNQPIRFGRRIIEVMRDTAALCADEGIIISPVAILLGGNYEKFQGINGAFPSP
jgi:hypothetical protein